MRKRTEYFLTIKFRPNYKLTTCRVDSKKHDTEFGERPYSYLKIRIGWLFIYVGWYKP